MERETGAEYGGEHYLLVEHSGRRCGQWGLHMFGSVVHGARNLECHDFAYALEVAAETEHVVLDSDIAQFHDVLTHQRVMFGKVHYFHI